MLAQNVVKLNNSKIYDQIQKYLDKHSYNSESTKTAYLNDIKLFFRIIKNKEIEYLTIDDVQITLDDFEDFIKYLYDWKDEEGNKKYVNKTINRKVSAAKGLIKYLSAKKINGEYIVKDISYFPNINSLPESKNQHGVLEASEVFEMAELALGEREKGEIKRLAILLSLDSCIRKSALLSLKWSNFIEKEDGYLLQGVDKGNSDFRQLISKELYNELLSIRTKSDCVFDISADSLDGMFKRLREKMKIEPNRRIVWHSIRKSGITYRYRLTGDILEAKRAANHANITTTQIYLEEEDYGAMGAVSSKGYLDMDLYKKVDHEILLEAIELMKKDAKLILNMKIKEILKQNN
ncbi:hypothetical protein AF332_11670 [Sporosarcina globispora]|uniref:Integrase n=1 Tax=Sporosarcina globispora TaxID=1459 RepID=A0A0M0GCC9_SPOGL|nr:site-specific integrase [Sporosarcina globispora]KON87418.1 hypothetical protein AF332_11670 [Sporosarcina globispora]